MICGGAIFRIPFAVRTSVLASCSLRKEAVSTLFPPEVYAVPTFGDS